MDLFDIDLNKLPQIQPWKNSFNSRVRMVRFFGQNTFQRKHLKCGQFGFQGM